jgi:hypothetical protein
MDNLWYSPPVAVIIFTLLVLGIYEVGRWCSEVGEDAPGKHLPYTGGELPVRSPDAFGYHAFFRLALLFGILHVAALVISTLPSSWQLHRTGLVYLAGVAVSVFVLTGQED